MLGGRGGWVEVQKGGRVVVGGLLAWCQWHHNALP